MFWFILGLFVGAAVGCLVSSLCRMSAECDAPVPKRVDPCRNSSKR
jgi:hypothetical protein